MRVINHRHLVRRKQSHKKRLLKWGIIGAGGLLGLFVIVNVTILGVYHGKVLPRTTLEGVSVGSLKTNELEKAAKDYLKRFVIIEDGNKVFGVYLSDLGMQPDWPTITKQAGNHGWLPLTKILTPHRLPLTFTSNTTVRDEKIKVLNGIFSSPAVPAHIAFENGVFSEVPAVGATEVDTQRLVHLVQDAISIGQKTIAMPYKHRKPPASTVVLAPLIVGFQKSLDAKIVFSHGANKRQLTRTEIGALYESSGQSMIVSEAGAAALISAVAKEFSITPTNKATAVSALTRAVSRAESASITLVATTDAVVRHYCTAVRGVDASILPELRSKLAAVYSDARGWNISGRVAFIYAESGCDYTVWLSAPASMTSFGGVCDSYYSCRSGNNVVLNYDRWMGATDPWNTAGGSLEDYRVMVINHETGHWLGFGHANCPGAGQPAPVMQQQSINLQGCTFNPWPTTGELATLKQSLGLH